jgi:hypothetical protein
MPSEEDIQNLKLGVLETSRNLKKVKERILNSDEYRHDGIVNQE